MHQKQHMLKGRLLIILLLAAEILRAQQAPPYLKRPEKVSIAIPDSTGIYVGDGDSTTLFYYALRPKAIPKGVLVLFPPTGETAENVLSNNAALLRIASDSCILAIVLTINYNLCLDKTALGFLNTVFADALQRFHLPQKKFVLGGFSLGGTNAIRYCELAYEDSMATVIRPAAIYGVDPPLDWARMYYSFSRAIEKNFSEPAVLEATSYLEKLNTRFGGSPDAYPLPYLQHSGYSRSRKDGGNARYLLKVPIRIYSDPDIDWWLKNRRVDYYDMNAPDQTAMINLLTLAGNDKAEFINALGRGYRANGMRHPHSWSIVAPAGCISWILQCLK